MSVLSSFGDRARRFEQSTTSKLKPYVQVAKNAARDTINPFIAGGASVIQGVVNPVRGGLAIASGALSAARGDGFSQGVQSFNRVLPPLKIAQQTLATNRAKGHLLGKPAEVLSQAGELAGSLAVPVPGVNKVQALEKLASPLAKFTGYSALRAGEGAAYGGVTGLAANGRLQDAKQGAASGALLGAAGNATLSPKLTLKAVREVGRRARQYGSNVARQPNLEQISQKLYAPVQATTRNNAVTGQFGQSRDAGTYTREFSEAGFDRAVRKGRNLAQTVEPTSGLSGKAKVQVTFDKSGNVVSIVPERPEFADYLEQSARNVPALPPEGNISRYQSRRIKSGEDLPQNLSLQGAQARTDARSQALAEQAQGVPQGTAAYLTPDPAFDPKAYVQELTNAQKTARGIPPKLAGVKNLLHAVKQNIVDSASPIEDVLALAQKERGYRILPENDISLQIDRSLRAPTLAGQFAKDNGLEQVIRQAPNLDMLDQYLIAKQASRVSEKGITTGRDLDKDQQLIAHLAPEYDQYAQQVAQYSRNLLDYAADAGLVDKNLATRLKEEYPDYVPLQRVFSEAEEALMRPPQGTGRGALASQGSQSAVKRLKGSEREIESPLKSLLAKTNDVFVQGERNKAAQQLISYKDLPGNPFQLRELAPSESTLGKATINAFLNGKKVTYETTPEIAEAAKRLNRQQLGFLGQIFAVPTRILKLGATGINLPFVVSNLAKDQATAFINSNRPLATSLANPGNFVRALFSALHHDELYEELVRNAGGGTSFDIARNAAPQTLEKIRASRSLPTKIGYTVTHPGELLRAAEDIVGRAEELTRVQQYAGTKQALLAEGRNSTNAALLAAQAARQNTTDFARGGDWSTALNAVIPYFNAGIQGSRTFLRAYRRDPNSVVSKLAVGVFMPVATLALWNLADPKRKAVYQDIPDYEKEGNMIIVLGDHQDPKTGRYDQVIKIPLSQEVAKLADIVRRGTESLESGDPVTVPEVGKALFSTATSLDTEPRKLLGQLTPQAIKPAIESVTNTNLYSGEQIVPDSLKDLPPEDQVRTSSLTGEVTTPKLAVAIGKATGTSPLKVENAFRTAGGGVGTQIIQGKSPLTATEERLTTAASGAIKDKQFEAIQEVKTEEAGKAYQRKIRLERAASLYHSVPAEKQSAYLKEMVRQGIVTKDNKSQFQELLKQGNPTTALSAPEKYLASQSVATRASYLRSELKKMPVEQRSAYLRGLIAKRIVTPEVYAKIFNP